MPSTVLTILQQIVRKRNRLQLNQLCIMYTTQISVQRPDWWRSLPSAVPKGRAGGDVVCDARVAEASKEIEKDEEELGDAATRCAPAFFFPVTPPLFLDFFFNLK